MVDDTNQENIEQENTNMDWKKNGFDKHERLTLRINMEEALRRNADKKIQPFSQKKAKTSKKPTKKIKKIKTSIYDEDEEDEEDYITTPVFNNLQRFSLEQILTSKEKKQLEKMEQEQSLSHPEKLQIQQINEEHIKEQQKEPVSAKKTKTAEEPQNIAEEKSDDLLQNIFSQTPQKQEEEKIDTILLDNDEKSAKTSIEDLLKEEKPQLEPQPEPQQVPEEQTEKDMRSLILEKSGRTSQLQQQTETTEETEQNTKETAKENEKQADIDIKNIKDAKEQER